MALDIDPYAYRRAVARASGDGIYLGSTGSQSVFASPERSVLVLGPPRAGKTTCIVIPSILSATGPVVSTSTKPEVMLLTANARSRAGETFLYDPTGTVERPKNVTPLVWSPVSACADWSEAMLVSKLMVSASRTGTSNSRPLDDHWHERAGSLIATLLHAAAIDGTSMTTVLQWVDLQRAGNAISILGAAGSKRAADLLDGISERTDQRERSGIFSTASGVLSAYHSDRALETTNGEPFSAREWAKTGGTVYICASARHQSLASPLVVGLLSEIRSACYEQASALGPGGREASPMLFALDEAANIAPLADLGQQLSEGGGQGLLTLVCLQDMSQARARWGQEADGWLSLFGSKVILGGIQDVRTLEMFSALAGDVEVQKNSVTTPIVSRSDQVHWLAGRLAGSRAPEPGSAGQNLTTSAVTQRRITVAELAKGRKDEALVFNERSESGYVELTPHFLEPWSSVIDPTPGIDRSPTRDPTANLVRDPARGIGAPKGPDLDFGR